MEQKIINLAIADDHAFVRQGIKNMISSAEGFEITIEAEDGSELIDLLQKCAEIPDICILDISMPNLNGYETLKELKKRWPSLSILILSAFYEEFSLSEMLRNGANGYLQKRGNPRKLLNALSHIYYGGYYYSESVAKKIFDLYSHRSPLLPGITEREMEFLCHCCSELNYREISELMSVSVRTVEAFRDALFSKFNIKSRTGLTLFALQNGIVPVQRNPGKDQNN
jgi:two-component system invasion response regulator UvrY